MDLPENVLKTLGKNPQGSVVVRRFGFDDLKVILPYRLKYYYRALTPILMHTVGLGYILRAVRIVQDMTNN